jgi:hypothetical protein
MTPQLFGVTDRAFRIATSLARSIVVHRTELGVEVWDGSRFDPIGGFALWDTGADFFTISEQFADQWGIDWRSSPEQLGAGGIGGSLGAVLVPLVIRLTRLRGVPFRVQCQVLLDSDFPQPLLGNLFVRRNFNVETRGERRTYFRLRDPAPDAVAASQLRTP